MYLCSGGFKMTNFSVFIKLVVTVWRAWRCWIRFNGFVKLLSILFSKFTSLANSIDHCWWVMIYYCRFLGVIFCWKFRNWEAKTIMFNISIDIRIYFSIKYLLIKGIHLDHLKGFDLSCDVKKGNWSFGKIQKTIGTKQARISKRNCKHILYQKDTSTQFKE